MDIRVAAYQAKLAERDVRLIAKEKGIKVRKLRSGVSITFPDGKKEVYPGWNPALGRFCQLV